MIFTADEAHLLADHRVDIEQLVVERIAYIQHILDFVEQGGLFAGLLVHRHIRHRA